MCTHVLHRQMNKGTAQGGHDDSNAVTPPLMPEDQCRHILDLFIALTQSLPLTRQQLSSRLGVAQTAWVASEHRHSAGLSAATPYGRVFIPDREAALIARLVLTLPLRADARVCARHIGRRPDDMGSHNMMLESDFFDMYYLGNHALSLEMPVLRQVSEIHLRPIPQPCSYREEYDDLFAGLYWQA